MSRELRAVPAMIQSVNVSVPIEPMLEIIGIFVFGLSGGLAAVRKQFDFVGVLVLAWVTALGGGLLRDVLIGAVPPVGIADWRLFVTALSGGVLCFFFHPKLQKIRRSILVLDAMGLALFAVAGTLKALEMGVGLLASVVVGILTGVGGGVLRDLLSGEVPAVLHHRELYAIPAALGALSIAILWRLGLQSVVTTTIVVVVVATFRLVAVKLKWRAPGPWQGRRKAS